MAHEHEWELDGRCDTCPAIAQYEYERLREALERIYQTYCTAVDPTDAMGRIAHKALAASKEGTTVSLTEQREEAR